MQIATDSVSSEPSALHGGVAPQRVILTADSLRANIAVFAPTEGRARFIAGSAATVDEPQRGIPGAFDRLAAKCGYAVSEDMTGVIVIAGRPIALHIIGDRSEPDAAALAHAERFGIARIAAEPLMPPRHPSRNPSWHTSMIAEWQDGRIEALLVIVPPGVLPLWAAQLLNALGDVSSPGEARCFVIGSDADLAAALPPYAIFIPRDVHMAAHLTDALNRLRAASLLHQTPGDTPILSRPQALAAATRAIVSEHGRPCVYLDVSDGTTVVVADDDGVAVHHDPEMDFARGTIRLLNRGPEHITRWIPAHYDVNTMRTWALRRVSAPSAPLVNDEDGAIAAAFVRAALRPMLATVASRIPAGAMWILGPSITHLGSHEAALHMVADLMPSVRSAVVSCDGDDVIPAIGALTDAYPDDASSLLTHDALVPTGSVVRASPSGERTGGSIVATLANGGRITTIEVGADQLTTIGGEGPATLSLTGKTSSNDGIAVQGGPGGILVDTRRRPLTSTPSHAPRPSVSGRLRPASTVNGILNR